MTEQEKNIRKIVYYELIYFAYSNEKRPAAYNDVWREANVNVDELRALIRKLDDCEV